MRIVVLINLKPETDVAEYEEWVRTTDIPGVRSLGSCSRYDVLRATGLFGSDAAPPYRYIEIIEVSDPQGFSLDVAGEKVQALAAKLAEYADNPVFIVAEPVA
jgi:hypothetical protein